MKYKFYPNKLKGTLQPMLSKSQLHRTIICYALAGNDTWYEQNYDLSTSSSDILATARAVKELKKDIPEIYCHESGTTLRLLLPIVMATHHEAFFILSPSLAKRPHSQLLDALASSGVTYTFYNNSLHLIGNMQSKQIVLNNPISSQYVSGLLFSMPLFEKPYELIINGTLPSRDYVNMTLNSMKNFGCIITSSTHQNNKITFSLTNYQDYILPNSPIHVEPDMSNLAFWLVANALGCDIKITTSDLNYHSNRDFIQGDKIIFDLLAYIDAVSTSDTTLLSKYDINSYDWLMNQNPSSNYDILLNLTNYPDLIPIISIYLALQDTKISYIHGVHRLKYKESNRLVATLQLLNSLGIHAYVLEDFLIIYGNSHFIPIRTIQTFNDHRIAMSAIIASTASSSDIILDDIACIDKSYTDFINIFCSLGGKYRRID